MGGEDEATTREHGAQTVSDADREPASELGVRRITGDRYRISEALGRGGMGEILHAHDLQIGRDVAIKRLLDERTSVRSIERFLREAKIQGRLDHPSIVPVYELGRDVDGRPYFAMKKLVGKTLATVIGDPQISRQRLLRAFTDACNAVEFAHERGVIHRDLKPDNIMLGEYGETYVLDWGVAKLVGEDDLASDGASHSDELTREGTIIGTPGYMAPEQALGRSDLDRRVDVYALGCILFEILTGERMHPKGQRGIDAAIAGATPRPSTRSSDNDIPPELDELCEHATADRERRIASARELGNRVQRYLDGDRDLMARTTLAKTHLASATAAFARRDHTTALRDAARAIALDPHLVEAAELVTRVMIEPPAAVPPEIESALDDDSDRVVRRVNKRIALTNLGYLTLVPFLIGRVHPGYIVMLFAIVAIKIGITWRMTSWGSSRVRYMRLFLNMLILALVARLFSPAIVVPGVAAVTAVGLMSGTFRSVRDGILVGVGLSVSVVAPYVAEHVGLLSTMITVEAERMVIDGPLLTNDRTVSVLVVLQTSLLVLIAIVTTHGLRLAERASRLQVRLQAWRLGQLVPASRPSG